MLQSEHPPVLYFPGSVRTDRFSSSLNMPEIFAPHVYCATVSVKHLASVSFKQLADTGFCLSRPRCDNRNKA
jgi:hypothetical protein